jgi:Coenzyme PQQ synthesis protein D (PqqD)
MIDLHSQPKRAERVLAQRAAESVILLKPDNGQYYTLDEVGARVWELCDGNRPVADLVSTIHCEYDAPLARIQADVLELLGELTREKLLAASA